MAATKVVAILDKAASIGPNVISVALTKCDIELDIIIVGATASEDEKNAVTTARTLVVILTPGISQNLAINTLISLAANSNVRIVGVWIGNSDDCPAALDNFADAVVPIESDQLCAALSGEFDEWIQATGSARAKREIKKANC